LFDAELLLEYQELLVEDSEQGKRIRSAVEQVLGVPPIANGKTAFRTLLKKAQTILAKETEHTKGLEAQAEHFKKLQAEIDALTASQAELKQKEHQVKIEIAGLETELAKTEAAQKAQARIDRLEVEKRAITERTEQLRADRLAVVAGAWRDLLQPRLKVRLASLNEDLARYEGQLQEIGALRERVRQLKATLAQSICSVCGQTIAAVKRETYAAELGQIQADLSILEASAPEITHVSNELLQLASLRGTDAAGRLGDVERELTRSAIKMTDCETSLEDIRKEVTGFDSAEVARLRSLQKQLHIHVGKLTEELQRLENDIATRAAKQNELSKLMSKGASARTQRSAIEVQLYRGLEDLFTGTIDELRDRLRTKVEEFASIAFGRLTTDQTYSGLQINESYGLTIVDRIRRPVPLRSAGAEQIVALSLIDGLNRTSRRAAPIVMDTPLARLDLNHRAKVLAYLPEMAEQVVLLVHEGEISKVDGLAPLAEHIGAVYEIERVSSSYSKLTKVQG
jgi:DNA sulfur modification protein DndD